MFDETTIGNPIEIIKSGLNSTIDTFTNGKHEAAFGEHTMIP
jgi:hypothetical protein